MINFLSTWIGQIVISVIIVTIFEMILPNGNLKKYIKAILGIYIIYCIITPFVNKDKLFDLDKFNLEKYTTNNLTQSNINQESMDKRLEKLYIEELERNIDAKIKEYGYEIYKCKIDAILNSNKENPGIHSINLTVKKVDKNIEVDKVEISNTKSNQKEENKDEIIEEMKQQIAEYLEISKDIVNIKLK